MISAARAPLPPRITSRNVGGLHVRWRFRLTRGSTFGAFASTPLVVGSTVYLQDLSSSVYALDLATGKLRWQYIVQAPNDGPNGLAFAGGRLFGATDTRVFALDARTGRHLWGHKLTNRHEQFVDIAPLAARGLVFTSTVGFAPSGRGALYALDQRTGKLRWRFDTIRDPWPYPSAGGGGAWYSPSLASDGRLYFGISNPGPWGGSPVRPNGGMFPGPTPYTDALLTPDRRHRAASLVRPGDEARRARLRPRGIADRRRPERLRRRQVRARRRVGPDQRQATAGRRWSERTCTTSGRCRGSRRSSAPGSGAVC